MKISFDIPKKDKSIIKVIGVGGGGGNAVAHMFRQGIVGVDFAICNTDAQAMDMSPVGTKISLGPTLTEGRGAGSRPEVGKEACIESIDNVRSFLSDGTKMLFVTAGMGGGTGTGAAPIIAKASKEMGILTVGIVTLPFTFEGMRRKKNALEGLENLRKNVDAILVISNDKLKDIYGNSPFSDALSNADDILTTAAKSISEIITVPGYINVDFEDVNYVMKDSGVAMMGLGVAEGENRARKAISLALNSPLLEDNDIRGAKHILMNIISGTKEVTMDEISEITEFVQEEAGYGTDIIWGNCKDESLGEKLSITLIATGFQPAGAQQPIAKAEPQKKVLLDDEFEMISETGTMDLFDKPTANTVDFDETPNSKKSANSLISREELRNREQLVKLQETENARREYLRNSTTLSLDSQDALEKVEKIPAYMRRGAKLEEDTPRPIPANKNGSSIWVDEEGTILQTGNSFLNRIPD